MDVYSTSFNVYPFAELTPDYAITPVHRHQSTNSGIEVVWDSLQRLSHNAMTAHPGTAVSFTHTDDGRGFNFHISGPYHPVMAARGLILRDSPVSNRSTIKVTRQEILESPTAGPSSTSNGAAAAAALKAPVIRRLDEIAAQTHANISVLKTASASSAGVNGVSPPSDPTGIWSSSGLESEKMCELIITGSGETVDVARIRLLVMLDEMASMSHTSTCIFTYHSTSQSGLHAEPAEIDYKLHAIIAGRRRTAIQNIQEETATNIYFPPLPLHSRNSAITPPTNNATNGNGTSSRNGSASPDSGSSEEGLSYNPNVIWITGEFFGVQRARDSLYQLAMNKVRSKTIISRDTAILPRKLDWMQTSRLGELKQISRDQGTYIQFPQIGSLTSLCTIYGDNRQSIERTVRSLMSLAAQFYVASFWLLPIHFNVMGIGAGSVNPAGPSMVGVLRGISCATAKIGGGGGAECVFKSNCFEMHGLESEVRAAVGMVLGLEVVKVG